MNVGLEDGSELGWRHGLIIGGGDRLMRRECCASECKRSVYGRSVGQWAVEGDWEGECESGGSQEGVVVFLGGIESRVCEGVVV